MKQNWKRALYIFVLVLLALGLYFFQKGDEIRRQAKNLLENLNIESIIEGIKQEVNTPGALVAKIESERAFLTVGGVFQFTNAERVRLDLNTLESNATLNAVAKARLDDMFANQYFEHISPTGGSVSKEAQRFGYEYISIGENIALGNFEDDETLVAAWMASSGHRANILSTKFTEIGIAVGKGIYQGKSTWMAVQVFARPLSECSQVSVSLKSKIDSEKDEISSLETQIKQLEVELEKMEKNRSNREAYNQKVSEYNLLVRQINDLIAVVKSDITKYNDQVKQYNNCIEQ